MESKSVKFVCLVCIFVLTAICGTLPRFVLKYKRQNTANGHRVSVRERIFSCLNCFAGGVFLGTCLLHLMIEGREEFTDFLKRMETELSYPVFETIVAAGFFCIALVEKLLMACMKYRFRPKHDGRSHPEEQETGTVEDSSGSVGDSESEKQRDETKDNRSFKNNGSDDNMSEAPKHKIDQTFKTGMAGNTESCHVTVKTNHVHSHTNNMMHASGLRSVILLLALSFHNVFDGLAIGLAKTESDVWQIFSAVSIHKVIAAFCLGLQLFEGFPQNIKRTVVWIIVFSLVSPVGLAIGIILTSADINEIVRDFASSILQGLAAGTFLYVTVFEILGEEFSHGGGFLQVLFAMFGFGAMASLKLLDT